MMAGRLPEAQAELERALELSPASVNSTSDIADVLILQGRADEALKVISRMPEGYRRDERLALAHFARGDVDESNAMLARLLTRAEKPEPDVTSAASLLVAIAEVYATRNEPDRAFAWLDKAHRLMRALPYDLKPWVLRENLLLAPHLKALHADPRWGQLLASIKK
jgi:tetratricopeptide (TPR) repeat protein